MTPELSALHPILADLGLPPAMAIAKLQGGSSEVFRLDLEDGTPLVLKTFVADHLVPRKDEYAASLLTGLEVPVTRYLLVDESRSRLPVRFALTSYLEGAAAISFAEHPRYLDVFQQMGALSKKLHTVAVTGFGQLPEPPYASNVDYVRGLWNRVFDRFLHYGAEPGLAARLRDIFDREFDAVVPHNTQAVFAHDDLQPHNVLVTEHDGELIVTGLIDYGNAQASSGVMDLAKTIFCCEHDAPGCMQAILSGYGSIDHPEPARALAFYKLLHRVIMWYWLRHIGVFPSADAPNDIIPALEATVADAA